MPRLDQIDTMLTKEPDDLFLNFARAMELGKLGRTDDAVLQFDRVITLNANYTPGHFQKGRTLLAAGRFEDAKSALRRGIEVARAAGEDHTADEMTELLATI